MTMVHVVSLMAECKPPAPGAGGWEEQVPGSGFHKYRPEETWAPAVNLYEDEDRYYVVVDLAGVQAQEISVSLDEKKGMVCISGHRPMPDVEAAGMLKLHLMEIDHGQFHRNVNLPSDADTVAVSAEYRGGFLRIQIPKR